MSLRPVIESFWDRILFLLVVTIGVISGIFFATYALPADAAMLDCIDATCRVTNEDGGKGTGVVVQIENGRVFVLTNAHVASSIRMRMEFWSDGHESVTVVGSTVLRVASRDVAIISIDTAVFGDMLPTVIQLASLDYELRAGQAVTSVGCAGGTWATAWRGNIRTVDGIGGMLEFNPTPALGRSGSAIFDASGSRIIGLIRVQVLEKKGGPPIYGGAVSLQGLYAAIYGDRVKTDYIVKDREVFWPPAVQVQCGPKGCPTPGGGGRYLPYRRQQGEIDRRQDQKIRDLYPTKPFVLPEPLKLEVEIVPVDPKPPVIKKVPPTAVSKLFIIGIILIFGAIGGIIGLVVQWKKTYSNKM